MDRERFLSEMTMNVLRWVLAVCLSHLLPTVCVAQIATDPGAAGSEDSFAKVRRAVCVSLWNHLAGGRDVTVNLQTAKFAMVQVKGRGNEVLGVIWNPRRDKMDSVFVARMIVPTDEWSRPYVLSEDVGRARVVMPDLFSGDATIRSRVIDFATCQPVP